MIGNKELENEREADQDGIYFFGDAKNLVGWLLNIDDAHRVTILAQHCSEVTQPEVSLMLKTHEHYGARRVSRTWCGGCTRKEGQRNWLTH